MGASRISVIIKQRIIEGIFDMDKNRFSNSYYNSYYYSNIIDNILTGNLELIGFISNFNEKVAAETLKPFRKQSAFHTFIAFIIREFFHEDMFNHDKRAYEASIKNPPLKELYAVHPLSLFGLEIYLKDFDLNRSNITWQEIEEYHSDLNMSECIIEFSEKISEEIFYLLFNNRELLRRFNIIMAHFIDSLDSESIDDEEIKKLFCKNGKLKRVAIPQWVKRAVFYRDRGHCCICNKDLSGTLSLSEREQYDHIVPLYLGGINDVSNIQLLCSNCNQKKGGRRITTSNIYERWY